MTEGPWSFSSPHDATSLRAWKEEHNLTSNQLAALCDVSLYTVMKWLRGDGWAQPWVRRALKDIGRSRSLSGPYLEMTKGGEAFRLWRIDQGITLTELAARIPASYQLVRQMERGQPLRVIQARAMRDVGRELRRAQRRPRA